MPDYAHSFNDIQLPARYGVTTTWTTLLAQYSADGVTGWTATTPADPDITAEIGTDPENPNPVDAFLTIPLSTAYFRFQGRDAAGILTEYTAKVLSPAASSTGDLCSLADVRQAWYRDAGDTTQDTELRAKITAASATIRDHCDREFIPATTGVARTFGYSGRGLVDVAPYDLRAVTSVTHTPRGGTATTVDATRYTLGPQPALHGVYRFLELREVGYYTRGTVTITGDWGFTTVPENVRRACIETVIAWQKQQSGLISVALADGATERLETRELPGIAVGLLEPFTRRIGL